MRKETRDKRNRAMGHLHRPGRRHRIRRFDPNEECPIDPVDPEYPKRRLAAAYFSGSSRSAAELMQ